MALEPPYPLVFRGVIPWEGGKYLVLLGLVGPKAWEEFVKARKDIPHPFDSWTRELVAPWAKEHNGLALYPFDGPPFHPFQAWALQAGGVFPSPLGPLIDPVWGLWHSYRAAVVLASPPDLPPVYSGASPCWECSHKPCSTICPVKVVRIGKPYDLKACLGFSACLNSGCLARQACPIGQDKQYSLPQQQFHIQAFHQSFKIAE